MHGLAARAAAVVATVYTALIQLFSPTSLAYRAAGESIWIDLINVGLLMIASVALADLVWRDILRLGLIFPSFPMRQRHQICVWVYAAMSAGFFIRAFIATGEKSVALQAGSYYIFFGAVIAIESVALALKERQECQQESKDA